MRLLLCMVLCPLLGCQNPEIIGYAVSDPGAATKAVQQMENEIIPPEIKDYLKMNFPDWTIPEISDYKTWWSFYEKSQIPFTAITDLNDDNLPDYAFILKNQKSIKLIILISVGNTFHYWIADDFKESYSENAKDILFGLAVEPPGRTDCVVNSIEQSLMLQTNGIALLSLEQKYQIYYWESRKINMFRVSSQPLH